MIQIFFLPLKLVYFYKSILIAKEKIIFKRKKISSHKPYKEKRKVKNELKNFNSKYHTKTYLFCCVFFSHFCCFIFNCLLQEEHIQVTLAVVLTYLGVRLGILWIRVGNTYRHTDRNLEYNSRYLIDQVRKLSTKSYQMVKGLLYLYDYKRNMLLS